MKITIADYVPPPCKRPRFGAHGKVYSPTAASERSLAWLMRASVDRYEKFSGNVSARIIVEYEKKVSGDTDNVAKTVLDAGEKAGFYDNDRQVVDLHITLRPCCTRARTLIEFVACVEGRQDGG